MDFYDELTPLYHLIYPDWNASIARQGQQLHDIIQSTWPRHRKVLDVSCGIGTQALGLAQQGYAITASDLSSQEVARARREAEQRGLFINFHTADMRAAFDQHGGGFDVVISCDNSVPHLLSDSDILLAFRQFFDCLRPGGGCVITVRDYAREERGRNLVKPYGVRIEGDKRYVLLQVWDFDGDCYDLSFYVIEDDPQSGKAQTRVMRSRYYAVSTDRLCELMREAGFEDVRCIDDVFFQPVLTGTKGLQSG